MKLDLILSKLRRLRFGTSQRETLKDHTAAMLKEIVEMCPVCRGPLESHRYRLVASMPLRQNRLAQVDDMIAAVTRHDWPHLNEFHVWEGDQSNAEVYWIECPAGGFSISIVLSPFALEEPHNLVLQVVGEAGESFPISSVKNECETKTIT